MSTRESQASQEFANRTWKLTLRGFSGRWVGIGPYLVHSLHPELAHQDLHGGHEWNGQEDSHDTEERAHYQDGEYYQGGMQVDGPAHYDRLEEVAFNLLDDDKGHNHPDGRERIRDQGQKHGNHDRDQRANVGDERDQTAEDTDEQSERHSDQGERYGPEHSDEGHGSKLAEEPTLYRLVQCLQHLSSELREAFGVQAYLGTKPEETLSLICQDECFVQDHREGLGELARLRLDGGDERQT